MASFNKIQIVGYLGRDPELRYTPTGNQVCDFTIATTERRKARDADDPSKKGDEVTTWFRVTLWGRQAEVASQYLQKGKLVFVEGRLSQREWQDSEGKHRTTLEVHGTDIQFIGTRSDGEQARAAAAAPARPASLEGARHEPPVRDEEIPF